MKAEGAHCRGLYSEALQLEATDAEASFLSTRVTRPRTELMALSASGSFNCSVTPPLGSTGPGIGICMAVWGLLLLHRREC